MLLVGNHSGGNMTVDTGVFTLAFSTYFGVERRFYQLAHNLVLSMPGLGFLRKYGTVAANPRERRARRSSRARRCWCTRAATTRCTGRPGSPGAWTSTGARASCGSRSKHDVPIVPVVSVGGQETALFLTRGEGLASCCGSTRCSG